MDDPKTRKHRDPNIAAVGGRKQSSDSPSLARRQGRGKFPPLADPSEFEGEEEEGLDEGPSLMDQSGSCIAEEREVFCKGTTLLCPEEMEGEWEGEIL